MTRPDDLDVTEPKIDVRPEGSADVEGSVEAHQEAAAQARARHATLRYNTLRLAIFLLTMAVLWLVRVKGLLLVALAFLISGLASYVFLRPQRDAMLAQLTTGLGRRRQRAAIRDAREDAFQDVEPVGADQPAAASDLVQPDASSLTSQPSGDGV